MAELIVQTAVTHMDSGAGDPFHKSAAVENRRQRAAMYQISIYKMTAERREMAVDIVKLCFSKGLSDNVVVHRDNVVAVI